MIEDNRFEIKLEEDLGDVTIRILVDNETGINYLMSDSGITPLLNEDGDVEFDYAD